MSESVKRVVTIKCPICENEFEYDATDAAVGDIIECPVCGANLEIVNITDENIEVEPITTYK